jgi:hypothetical protein
MHSGVGRGDVPPCCTRDMISVSSTAAIDDASACGWRRVCCGGLGAAWVRRATMGWALAVSKAFPSCVRSVWTEMYLCHACCSGSAAESARWKTPRNAGISVGGIPPNRAAFSGALLPGVDHLPHTHSLEHAAFSRGQPEWGAHLADQLEVPTPFHPTPFHPTPFHPEEAGGCMRAHTCTHAQRRRRRQHSTAHCTQHSTAAASVTPGGGAGVYISTRLPSLRWCAWRACVCDAVAIVLWGS